MDRHVKKSSEQVAVVLFSGGQDSAISLVWALENFDKVFTISFDYGQRHNVELDCCDRLINNLRKLKPHWSKKLHQKDAIKLDFIPEISDSSLTSNVKIEMTNSGLPNTFVPGRNIFFLSIAASFAYRLDAGHIVGGMCQTDYSGYPDCREEFMRAMERSISLGMGKSFEIHTPLMLIDKAESWEVAENIGGLELVDVIVEGTHTCYLGVRDKLHDWGYGCGHCPACILRKSGYNKYKYGGVA